MFQLLQMEKLLNICKILLISFYLCFGKSLNSGISCRNDNGTSEDWFYAYKLPKKSSSHSIIKSGYGYVYLLSSLQQNDWTLSSKATKDDKSMMGLTLAPLYTIPRNSDIAFILYNDETPDGSITTSKGHSKGVLVINQQGGFWMMHSVPKYPPFVDQPYSFPKSGLTYGQNFLCITLKYKDIDKLGMHFQYSKPNIYNYSMPQWTRRKLPNLYDVVVNGKYVKHDPWYFITDLMSKAGLSFKSFSKHSKYGKDVYSDLISPTVKSDLYVETWIHGRDRIPSKCGNYDIMNVNTVLLKSLNVQFNSTEDHSKWAVTPENSINLWICVGDINHMKSQFKRGGITVCQKSYNVWRAYSSCVDAVQPCAT